MEPDEFVALARELIAFSPVPVGFRMKPGPRRILRSPQPVVIVPPDCVARDLWDGFLVVNPGWPLEAPEWLCEPLGVSA